MPENKTDAETQRPAFITIAELAELLRVSNNTVYRKKNMWPHYRFGTEIRFSEDDVTKILAMNHREPIPEMTRQEIRERNNRIRGYSR